MLSIRNDIDTARDRKKFPAFASGSMLDLGIKLKLPVPISLRKLDDALKDLWPASVTYDSPPLNALHVDASAQIFLQSDGLFSFSGKAHENGIVGANYLVTMTFFDIKDADGKVLVFAHDGNVKGTVDFGSSDDQWKIDGFNQAVMDQWDTIRSTSVKTQLHVSVDPWQVTETVLLGLVGAAAAGLSIVMLASPDTHCDWELSDRNMNPDDHSPGVDYRCRREWE